METQQKLSKILEALAELAGPVNKTYLMDFLCGRDNDEIADNFQTEMETYGICQAEDDALTEVVLDMAIKKGYITCDEKGKLTLSEAGRAFCESPEPFHVDYDDDDEPEDATLDGSIDQLIDEIDNDSDLKKTHKKSSLKINLIHAIDNKKALDDWAEAENLDFDVVLDEMEHIIHNGTHINIDYFLDEVFTQDNIDEVMECLKANDGDLKKAEKEFDAFYAPEELRLIRIKYLCEKRKQ